jgi:hypothetical protein
MLKDSNIIPLVLDIFIVFECLRDDLFFFKRGSAIFLSGKNRRTRQLSKERVTYEIEE